METLLTEENNGEIVAYTLTSWNQTSTVTHDLVVIRRTEASTGIVSFGGISVVSTAVNLASKPKTAARTRKIEAIGDSLTCGYGDLGTYPCTWSTSTEVRSFNQKRVIY